MAFTPRIPVGVLLSVSLLYGLPAAADDLDALDLKSAPVDSAAGSPHAARLFVEAAFGSVDQRYVSGTRTLRRAALDYYQASRLAPGWRMVLSDRVDHLRPPEAGVDDTVNSLREAYVGWENESGNTAVEFGRINLRNGPAYGFNPTDFFRDGAIRIGTTVNPFALRENRLGTVMLRAQRLWQGGSVSMALAPKLADAPSGQGLSLDLGATNQRSRLLLTASHQVSERVSGQVLLYKEPGLDAQPGASLTALLNDATVAHVEWSHAREPELAARAQGSPGPIRGGHRFAGGVTYTTSSKLSLTAELQYNGLALDRSGWDKAVATGGPAALGGYLREADRRQDLASRRAVLLYATQKSLGWKNCDLTAFVRLNGEDHSRLSWLELRYHWQQTDLALQWQRYDGRATSQYGVSPDRQLLQFVVAHHFW